MTFNFPGDGSPLYHQMVQTYSKALAPGTYVNRDKQARCYLTFAVMYGVHYLAPLPVHICMFYQFLANRMSSVSSIKNYISGARTWVIEHGGNPLAFSGYEQSMMIKAITKDSGHVVHRAFPLTLYHISVIVAYLDSARNVPLSVKPCILIGFSCYLRSSNLVSPNFVVWGGHHSLLTKHIVDSGPCLHIVIPSTKTRTVPYSVVIAAIPDSILCPVRAWRDYVAAVKPHRDAPAFIINHMTPLTSTLVVKFMRDALSGCKDVNVAAVSMHSLRRGAAQQAARNGSPKQQIMDRGGWASKSGLAPYLSQ